MTVPTLKVLNTMARSSGPLFGLNIAKQTGLSTGTVYPILGRLARAGLLERTSTQVAHPRERKTYRLKLGPLRSWLVAEVPGCMPRGRTVGEALTALIEVRSTGGE